MDQNAPNGSGKGTWRDKLGLGAKELPRISDQFKEAALADAKAAARPAVKPPQPVSKLAPMAPRPGAAKAAPPPAAKPAQPTSGGALVDRLKAQREAAERLAEQRIATARQKAEGATPAVPMKNGNGAAMPAPEKPKFSFADEEQDAAKEAREQAPAAEAKPAGSLPSLGAKPAAEPAPKLAKPEAGGEAQAKPTVQPKLSLPLPPLAQGKPQLGAAVLKPGVLPSQRSLSGGQTNPIMPPRPQLGTAMPQPGFKPAPPQVPPFDLRPLGPKPPAYQPPLGQQGFRPIDPPGYQRPPASRGFAGPGGFADSSGLSARRDAYESYRRQQPQQPPEEVGPGDDGMYQDEPQLGPPPPRRALRDGATARGRTQAYEDDMGEVFEDEAPPPQGRRRASAQDYSRAYREYEEHGHGEEPRRSLWPWILMLALLIATAIALAGGWYYMNYMRAPQAAGVSGSDPKVVAAPAESDKSRSIEVGGTDKSESDPVASAEPDPAVPAATKKKLIYDRILGDQAIDGGAIVPTEEPPVAPSDTTGGQSGSAAEPPPPAVSGQGSGEQGAEPPPAATGQTGDPAAVPDPLPVPPAPGSDGTQGALDKEDDADVAEIQPAGAPPEGEAKPAPTQGEVLVLNAQEQPVEQPVTRSFGAAQTGKDPARLDESGTTELALKQAEDGAATAQPNGGSAEVKQAELPPPNSTEDKAEAVEIKPAQSGDTDEIVPAKDAAPLDAPVPGDTDNGKEAKDVAALGDDTADAADAEPDPAARVVDEPVVKKPAAKKAVSKKPKQKAAARQAKTTKKKAKAATEDTATATLSGVDEPAAAQQTENAPIADGPLKSAEAQPPKKRSFFDLFRRKSVKVVDEPASKKVANAAPPPEPVKKRAVEPAAANGFGIQLGVFRTEAEARAEINRLQSKHGAKVGGMQARVGRTQVAGSTRFRAGFSGAQSRGDADQLCSALRAAGERDCVVRRQ